MSENPFDQGGSPAISFAIRNEDGTYSSVPVGTKYNYVVTETPKEVQARTYDGKPAFWPDGNPKKTIVTGIEVNGEARSWWAPRPSGMFSAIKEALTRPTGVLAMEVGGYGTIELVGFKPSEDKSKAAQKLYKVTYNPPNAFAAENTKADTPVSAPSGDVDAARAAKLASLSPEDRALLGL